MKTLLRVPQLLSEVCHVCYVDTILLCVCVGVGGKKVRPGTVAETHHHCSSSSLLQMRIGTFFSATALNLRSKILQKEELRVGLVESVEERQAPEE